MKIISTVYVEIIFMLFLSKFFHFFFRLALRSNLVSVETNKTPKANVPALASVFNPSSNDLDILPEIASSIVQYIPLPGTNGIRAQTTNVVTGVLKILARTSLYILKIIDEINSEEISDKPICNGSE